MKHKPVQIVGEGKNGKHLEFREKAYQQILEKNKNKGIEQLCVLSVAGKKRTGKSFLLSILLRFLVGMGMEGWMKRDIALDEGFAWRSGHKGHTMGIWAWDELFIMNSRDGTKTGIMLIDTQGTFDLATHTLQTSHVFAISTLISSILVYNVQSDISLDALQHLQLFVSLASVPVSRQMEGNAPFQSLVFLVRDWVHTEDHLFGEEGGNNYWEYVRKTTDDGGREKDPKKHGLMEGIKSSFKKSSCYLMPTPGPEVTEKTGFRLLNTIKRVDFLDHLEKLTLMLFADPIPKRIGGTLMSPSLLGVSLKTYTELFSGDEFPEPPNIAEATADIFNKAVSDKAITVYEDKMKKQCSQGSGYLGTDVLQALHSMSRDEAVEFYSRQQMMTLPGKTKKDLERMFRDRIERVFEKYSSINNGNRGIWYKFDSVGFPVLAAAASTVLATAIGPELAIAYATAVALPTVAATALYAGTKVVTYFTRPATVPEVRDRVVAGANPAAANDNKTLTEMWRENALLICVLFLVYSILAYILLSTIPFLQSILVFSLGGPFVLLLHSVIFAILCQRLLNYLSGAAMI